MVNVWEMLDIEPTADIAEIRRAYAVRIRVFRPETDPENFARLREAYEIALNLARQQAEPSETTEPPIHWQQNSASLETSATPRHSNEPTVEERGRSLVRDLVRTYMEEGEPAAVSALHEQLSELHGESVDMRLAWEGALMYWFLADEAPPPGLLFEADLLLGWSGSGYHLARQFGDPAALRLHQLLELAHWQAYAVRFSTNRWESRLFSSISPPWVGLAPWMRTAKRRFAAWTQACDLAGARQLGSLTNSATVRRLGGKSVQSTDLLLGVVVCWAIATLEWVPAWSSGAVQIWGFYAGLFVLFSLLPCAARYIKELPSIGRFRERVKPLGRLHVVVLALLFGVPLIGSSIAIDSIHPQWVRVIGWSVLGVFVVSIVGFLSTAAWYCLRFLELAAFMPLVWLLELWGQHRFDRYKQLSLHDRASAEFRADLIAFPSALTRRLGRVGQGIFARLRAGSGLAPVLILLCGFTAWVTYYLMTIRPWFMKSVLKVQATSFGLLEVLHLVPVILIPLIAIGIIVKMAEAVGLRRPR